MMNRGRGNKSARTQIQARRRRLAKLLAKGVSTGEAEIILQREGFRATDRVTIGIVGVSTIDRYNAMKAAHGDALRLIDACQLDPTLDNELNELVEVSHAYDVHHSPSAVIVTPAGTIGSATVDARRAILALIRLALAESAPARVPVGASVALPAA